MIGVGVSWKLVLHHLWCSFKLPEMSCSHVISLESIIIVCLIDWFCHFWKRGCIFREFNFNQRWLLWFEWAWLSNLVSGYFLTFHERTLSFSASMETSIINVVWPCSSTSSIVQVRLLSTYVYIYICCLGTCLYLTLPSVSYKESCGKAIFI